MVWAGWAEVYPGDVGDSIPGNGMVGMGFAGMVEGLMAAGDSGSGAQKHKTESKRGPGWLPPKRKGEMAELAFMRKAIGMGLMVSKTWGDSDRYDFIVDGGGRRWRVQVRSTETRLGPRGYAVHASIYVGKKIVGLTKDDIDFIVAYLVPLDLWYVVPVEGFQPRKNLWFYPMGSKKGARFEKYREAWWILRGAVGGER